LILSQAISPPAPADWNSFREYFAAFQHDDNAEFIAWIAKELPPDAVVAKDSRIRLPRPGNAQDAGRFPPIPQKVRADKYAADLGTLAQLRALGITHVAVSKSDYGKFFLPGISPQAGEGESFMRRRAFYEELFRDGRLLFQRERGTVLYLHPGIQLYRIAANVE
jgi:hypothetical protein